MGDQYRNDLNFGYQRQRRNALTPLSTKATAISVRNPPASATLPTKPLMRTGDHQRAGGDLQHDARHTRPDRLAGHHVPPLAGRAAFYSGCCAGRLRRRPAKQQAGGKQNLALKSLGHVVDPANESPADLLKSAGLENAQAALAAGIGWMAWKDTQSLFQVLIMPTATVSLTSSSSEKCSSALA